MSCRSKRLLRGAKFSYISWIDVQYLQTLNEKLYYIFVKMIIYHLRRFIDPTCVQQLDDYYYFFLINNNYIFVVEWL